MNYIYYFTGTGNSLQIALDLSNEIKNSKLCKIAQYNGEYINADTLGIIFPVYNWGMPLIIKRFIENLKCNKDTFIYAITNFAGLPGKALDQCRDALKENNLSLSLGFLIKMPGNYIVSYGAKSEKEQQKIFNKEKEKIKQISKSILNKEHKKIEVQHSFIDRVFNDYFYKDIVNFHTKDKGFSVDDNCVGCSLCEKRCPVNNIKIVNNKPVWNHKCEFCLACIQSCPNHAINYLDKTQNHKQYINPNVTL